MELRDHVAYCSKLSGMHANRGEMLFKAAGAHMYVNAAACASASSSRQSQAGTPGCQTQSDHRTCLIFGSFRTLASSTYLPALIRKLKVPRIRDCGCSVYMSSPCFRPRRMGLLLAKGGPSLLGSADLSWAACSCSCTSVRLRKRHCCWTLNLEKQEQCSDISVAAGVERR